MHVGEVTLELLAFMGIDPSLLEGKTIDVEVMDKRANG